MLVLSLQTVFLPFTLSWKILLMLDMMHMVKGTETNWHLATWRWGTSGREASCSPVGGSRSGSLDWERHTSLGGTGWLERPRPPCGKPEQAGHGWPCSFPSYALMTPAGQALLNRFPWGQNLRRKECSGVFKNDLFPPLPAGRTRRCLPTFTVRTRYNFWR